MIDRSAILTHFMVQHYASPGPDVCEVGYISQNHSFGPYINECYAKEQEALLEQSFRILQPVWRSYIMRWRLRRIVRMAQVSHCAELRDAHERIFVARELFDSEVSYIAGLQDLLQCFLLPIQEMSGEGGLGPDFALFVNTVQQMRSDHSAVIDTMRHARIHVGAEGDYSKVLSII